MNFDPLQIVFTLVPMILALTVHEFAHAFVAHKLGDDTALRAGRMTLNPISHIDPIGTLLIPVVGTMYGVPFFGWAKPVPVTPANYTRKMSMAKADILVSAAGPVSNLIFALVMALFLGVIGPMAMADLQAGTISPIVAVVRLAGWTLLINIGLFIFNLLPVPPLDGSHVLAGLLPRNKQYIMEFLSRYSFILFILLLMFGGRFIIHPILWLVSGLSSLVGFDLWWALAGQ